MRRTLYVCHYRGVNKWWAATIDVKTYTSCGGPVGYFRQGDHRLYDNSPTWFGSPEAAVAAVTAAGYLAEVEQC